MEPPVASRTFQSEPFIERIERSAPTVAAETIRFGYRPAETPTIIAAIDLPADVFERFTASLTPVARITPKGTVFSSFTSASTEQGLVAACQPIDDLVRATVDADNLFMEEATIADLTMLFQRLENSLTYVASAIESLETAKRTRSD